MRRLLVVLFGLLLAWVGVANAVEALDVVPSLHGPAFASYDASNYDAPEHYTYDSRMQRVVRRFRDRMLPQTADPASFVQHAHAMQLANSGARVPGLVTLRTR